MPTEKRLRPNHIFQDADWGPVLVVIPAGEFWMGSDEGEQGSEACERPRHRVVIERPFALAQTPVTRQQFARFIEATANADWTDVDDRDRRSHKPLVNVSWHHAQAYTRWLSEQLGASYGLPTEAQWEYACRAGTATAYSTGDSISTSQAKPTSASNSMAKTLLLQATRLAMSMSAATPPTHGACTTCMAISGNGFKTLGTATTTMPQ